MQIREKSYHKNISLKSPTVTSQLVVVLRDSNGSTCDHSKRTTASSLLACSLQQDAVSANKQTNKTCICGCAWSKCVMGTRTNKPHDTTAGKMKKPYQYQNGPVSTSFLRSLLYSYTLQNRLLIYSKLFTTLKNKLFLLQEQSIFRHISNTSLFLFFNIGLFETRTTLVLNSQQSSLVLNSQQSSCLLLLNPTLRYIFV